MKINLITDIPWPLKYSEDTNAAKICIHFNNATKSHAITDQKFKYKQALALGRNNSL